MRDIELKIPSAKGIPEGSLISIRLGTVRRQAVFGSDRPYRFQGQYNKSELMRVDVYMPIASAKLMLDTDDHQGHWTQKLESAFESQQQVSMDFDSRITGDGKSGLCQSKLDISTDTEQDRASGMPEPAQPSRESSAKRHQVAIEAQPYFEQHDVMEVLRELLQAMIKEKPEDPYAFMIKILESSRSARAPSAARKPPQTAPLGGRPKVDAQTTSADGFQKFPRPPSRVCSTDDHTLRSSIVGAGPNEQAASASVQCPRGNAFAGDENSAENAADLRLHDNSSEKARTVAEPGMAGNSTSAANACSPSPLLKPSPPVETPPMLPSTVTASPPTGGAKCSYEEELAEIRGKLRGNLAAKVKEGGLQDILASAGFGVTPRGPSKDSEVDAKVPPSQPNRPQASGTATSTVASVANVAGQNKTGAQAELGSSEQPITVKRDPSTLQRELSETAVLKDILSVRDRLRNKLVEKHATGSLDTILSALIDGDDETVQKTIDVARVKLQTALAEKFQKGDLDAIFDAITGATTQPQPPPPPSPTQPRRTAAAVQEPDPLPPISGLPKPGPLAARLPPATKLAAGTQSDQSTVELEEYRRRLREALTGATTKGTLPGLLENAFKFSSRQTALSTTSSQMKPVASSLPAQAAMMKPGVPKMPSKAVPPTRASPEELRKELRLALVQAAGPGSQAAGPEAQKTRQSSWCSEVGRLKDETFDLTNRTERLENTVSALMQENLKLRQEIGKTMK